MNKKRLIIITFLLITLSILGIYLFKIIKEEKNTVKFITTFYAIKKQKAQIVDELNSCIFSKAGFINGVNLTCKVLKKPCTNLINENKISKDTACAILEFNVSNFDKNYIFSNNDLPAEYQALVYLNDIVVVPDTIEHRILYKKERTLRRKIQNILLLFEVANYPEMLKKNKKQ